MLVGHPGPRFWLCLVYSLLAGTATAPCEVSAEEGDDATRQQLVRAFDQTEVILRSWSVDLPDGTWRVEMFRAGRTSGLSVRRPRDGGDLEVVSVSDGTLVVTSEQRAKEADRLRLVPGPGIWNEGLARWRSAAELIRRLWGYEVQVEERRILLNLGVSDDESEVQFGFDVGVGESSAGWLSPDRLDGKEVRVDRAAGTVVFAGPRSRIVIRVVDGTPHTIQTLDERGGVLTEMRPSPPQRDESAWRRFIARVCPIGARGADPGAWPIGHTVGSVRVARQLDTLLSQDPQLQERGARLWTVVNVMLAAAFGHSDFDAWLRRNQVEGKPPLDVSSLAEAIWTPLWDHLSGQLESRSLPAAKKQLVRRATWNAVWALAQAASE